MGMQPRGSNFWIFFYYGGGKTGTYARKKKTKPYKTATGLDHLLGIVADDLTIYL